MAKQDKPKKYEFRAPRPLFTADPQKATAAQRALKAALVDMPDLPLSGTGTEFRKTSFVDGKVVCENIPAEAVAKIEATEREKVRQRAPGAGRKKTIAGEPWKEFGWSRSKWFAEGKPTLPPKKAKP